MVGTDIQEEFEFEDKIKGIRLRFRGDKPIERLKHEFSPIFEDANKRKFDLGNASMIQSQQLQTSIGIPIQEPQTEDVVPQIKDKTMGLTDFLRRLGQTPWFIKGRFLREIEEACQYNAIHVSRNALSATLSQMVSNRELRKLKEGGQWKYSPFPFTRQ